MLFDSNGILGKHLTTADQLDRTATHGNTRKYQLTTIVLIFKTGRTFHGRTVALVCDAEIIAHGNGVVCGVAAITSTGITASAASSSIAPSFLTVLLIPLIGFIVGVVVSKLIDR